MDFVQWIKFCSTKNVVDWYQKDLLILQWMHERSLDGIEFEMHNKSGFYHWNDGKNGEKSLNIVENGWP